MGKRKEQRSARKLRRRMQGREPQKSIDEILMRRLADYTADALALQPEPDRTLMGIALGLGHWAVDFGKVNGVESIASIVDGQAIAWIPLPIFDPDNLLGWRDPPRRPVGTGGYL
jgi:hypothetical protein